MTEPRPLALEDLVDASLSPRFGVEQGSPSCRVIWWCLHSCVRVALRLQPDGSCKIRPIDDMSASMINAATCAAEKCSCDTLDVFFASMRRLEQLVKGPKQLWKADIDAAFRRIPIQPNHRQYAQVVLQVGDVVYTSAYHHDVWECIKHECLVSCGLPPARCGQAASEASRIDIRR